MFGYFTAFGGLRFIVSFVVIFVGYCFVCMLVGFGLLFDVCMLVAFGLWFYLW